MSKTRVILVCPTLRYVVGKCCDDPKHIDNFNSSDYGDDLNDFQDQHRRLLGGWGTTTGINYDILDLTAVVGPGEPILGNRKSSGGASIWADEDSREAYMDAASAIVEIATGCGSIELDDSASSSGTSDMTERKQPESVVTFPAPPTKRRGGEDRVCAGWMRGEAERGGPNRGMPWRGGAGGWRTRSRAGIWAKRGWRGRSDRGRMRRAW
jgi:hypothetical protein